MTFKEYVDGVNKMLEEHPEYGEMEMEQTERWADEEVTLPQRCVLWRRVRLPVPLRCGSKPVWSCSHHAP